ncbi:gamma-glutamyltranspeptidase / glutathione hydrolase / leukotriene-C4 hydrolase [Nematocida minor]|uniref:gamma-glutamyltranspeptidase / glutathione hydrolase / leukotriene-C4 hydrolase n=1 Tax=Nematocida minor TaxID=1912983 RepID=UPI00221FC9DC|nr:gamma-glutamyltranspeptidase / glutathione hydrolase / leukotriene-C4 hydrolase [Nematocida minor]KAI5189204.1 gamma-glutamyltranspeptidase / glutathione hydrolase / leukotriene-C4 hydrolase [Nematocida minor]
MVKRKKRYFTSLIIMGVLMQYLKIQGKMAEYSLPVVTSDLKIAADFGYKIMEKGGNAVDAAVTTAIVVGSINAFASGLGGGGFMLLMKDGQCSEYNFREKAPGSAKHENYKLKEDSMRGPKSIAIPHEILGLYTVHSEHGHLPWSELFTDAIQLLKDGFIVPPVLGRKLEEFRDIIYSDPGLRETYVKNGVLAKENDTIKRENLSRTLEIISKNPTSFYLGSIGESLLSFINKEQTYITKEELEKSEVLKKKVKAEIIDGDTEVYTAGLPTTGYMLRIALAVLKKIRAKYHITSEETLQKYLIIIYNELFMIRTKLDDLQDEAENIKSLLLHTAQEEIVSKILRKIENKNGAPFTPFQNNCLADHGTTHINIIDREGTMVSLTSTINQYWGSGMMDPKTGIILNNQIDDFTFRDFSNGSDIQSLCEVSQNNWIKPYKQPLSSAMPSFIRIEDAFYVVGSSGGIRIPTAVISTISRILISNLSVEDAINHPRLHYQGSNTIKIENNYATPPPDLGVLWNIIRDTPSTISSCVHIIKYSPHRKRAYAIADRRKLAAVTGAIFEENTMCMSGNAFYEDVTFSIMKFKTPLEFLKN